jgi:hypothetical protein
LKNNFLANQNRLFVGSIHGIIWGYDGIIKQYNTYIMRKPTNTQVSMGWSKGLLQLSLQEVMGYMVVPSSLKISKTCK